MAQVTIYLPDAVEKRLRREAKRAKKSVSAFITELTARTLEPAQWPPGFASLAGSWTGRFPSVEDPPPDDVSL